LLADLQALPKVGEYVFSGKTAGEPVTTMRKSFASAVATADIRRNGKVVRITPHTLRKAYATWAVVDWCIPQPVLQSILGHAPGSTVTNAYYVMVSEEAKRKAVVELPL
jgi:integrase